MTPEDAAITAKVYEILSRGKKYQWRHIISRQPWSAPFGIESIEDTNDDGGTECGTFRAGIEVREAPAEPREFIIGLDSTGFAVAVGNDRVMLLCGNNSSADVASQIRVREIIKGES